MKPYGAGYGQSPSHVKRGGAPDGFMDTFESACGCCDGTYLKKTRSRLKPLKTKERRAAKSQIEEGLHDHYFGDLEDYNIEWMEEVDKAYYCAFHGPCDECATTKGVA